MKKNNRPDPPLFKRTVQKSTGPKRYPPAKLKGKRVRFYYDPGGFREGTVLRVDTGPRIGFRGVTVLATDGRTLKLRREQMEVGETCGVIWHGKLRPLAEWLEEIPNGKDQK